MPLILAIEPDRRQANQLNVVVKGRLRADLVLADSAERALAALGDRVPDLILTSALLSPNDEVVLGERLRALDGMAAHVQTLTIPVFAGPRPRARAKVGGVLSALRRGKPEPAAPDGCDPAVFAAQCAEYLERAVTEHAVNAAATEHAAEPVVEPAAPIVEAAAPIVEPAAPIVEPSAPVIEASKPDPIVPTVRKAPVAPLVINERVAAATVQEAIAQIEAMVARESLAASAPAEPDAEPDVPDGFIDLDLSFLDDRPADKTSRPGKTHEAYDDDDEPIVYEINVTIEDAAADSPVPLSTFATLATTEATSKNAKTAKTEDAKVWTPARLGVSQLWPPMDGVVAEPPAGAQADNRALVSAQGPARRAQLRQKPVQDEWGFFDPDQCGFAALLAKLDEIIEVDDGTAVAKPTRGRPRR